MEYDERVEHAISDCYDEIAELVRDEDKTNMDHSDFSDLVREWAYVHKDRLLKLEADHD